MNDYNVDLTGLTVTVRNHPGAKVKTRASSRQFVCESGPGCKPTPNTRRGIIGHWVTADGLPFPDDISSYDIEEVPGTTRTPEPEGAIDLIADVVTDKMVAKPSKWKDK